MLLNKAWANLPYKLGVYLLISLHILTGCAGSAGRSGTVETGPQPASSYDKVDENRYLGVKPEVIIPVFSPGLSDSEANYEEAGIWPELRRAEANRFAFQLKQALDNRDHFSAVRVTPNSSASGDLYLLGDIIESNGQRVAFRLTAVDASNRQWLSETFEHEVHEGFYKNPRNTGQDPYQPVFDAAAEAVIEALLKQKQSYLTQLKSVSEMRFANSFSDAAFGEYLDTSGRYIDLQGLPSDADPMFERVKSIRVREQLFIDNLQSHYQQFSTKMDSSYLAWQQASATELALQKEAKRKSVWKMLGGVALVAAAVAAAVSGSSVDQNIGRDVAVIAGGVGGALLISSGFKSREEAKFHQDALNELGESINLEMAPQVITYEEESVELSGDIEQQFQQWRAFLNRMYQLEATPDIQL
ncbi:hypothetical protein Q7C_2574 [Methylophaga frappieri]|uniref:Lipoprotein n=1 Tax=Methylophaga frappieri (strain ATCC BAA-2434 / DSM 25690 / JAM7) TaxID=754477 RepID=I1YLA2_METFJ|nr:hypothetical protein [Methylophaga frappieri]AFJ03695.1 hypothetical protein Q7C_2574 [Methylophaga frappieri]